MDVNKERQLEPLKDLDEREYFEVLKNKKVDEYENEIALSKSSLSIPNEIMELPIQAQYMLSFYNDKEWKNKVSGKKTYNDIVECYIASLKDDEWLRDLYEDIVDKVSFDKDGKKQTTYKKGIVAEQKGKYMLLKQKAISYWNENNLQQVVPIFKKLMLGGIKQEDMLKDEILENALHHQDENIKLKYVKHAIDVTGIGKNQVVLGQDVWLKGGGKDFGTHLANYMNDKTHDISKFIEGEIDEK